MVKYQQYSLENGVRVMAVPLPGLRSVTIEVFVKIGSKYEEEKVYGISHFLEHMAFKGSQKRPTANEIHKELDAKGASHNAGTGHEFTSYYIKTIKENIPWAIELLGDILLNPTIPEAEVEKEKLVIVEEIKMYEDNPAMGLGSEFMELLYKDTGVGCWNISGSEKSVLGIDRSNLIEYRNKYLNPAELVVVISGDVDAARSEELKGEVNRQFGKMRRAEAKLPKPKMIVSEKFELRKKKDIEQGHFCLGVPSVGWKDKRKYASRLIDVIMAGNSSSRLFNKIREERGWAYYIYSASDMFEEAGFNAVQVGARMDKIEEAIELCRQEYLELASEVTEEELSRAKDYLIGRAKLNMDRTDFWSDFVGQKMLLENKQGDLEEEIRNYSEVNLQQLKDFGGEYFRKEEIKLLVVAK